MAYVKNAVGAMVQHDPKQAKVRILAAYREAKGFTAEAATVLGVKTAALFRWVAVLDLHAEVGVIRAESGHFAEMMRRQRAGRGLPRNVPRPARKKKARARP